LEKAMRETNPAISGQPQAVPALPINVTEPITPTATRSGHRSCWEY
jgi:hypothetical protein